MLNCSYVEFATVFVWDLEEELGCRPSGRRIFVVRGCLGFGFADTLLDLNYVDGEGCLKLKDLQSPVLFVCESQSGAAIYHDTDFLCSEFLCTSRCLFCCQDKEGLACSSPHNHGTFAIHTGGLRCILQQIVLCYMIFNVGGSAYFAIATGFSVMFSFPL
ncbi:hypothetical protein AAG906_030249 [Vitis piasezkii]